MPPTIFQYNFNDTIYALFIRQKLNIVNGGIFSAKGFDGFGFRMESGHYFDIDKILIYLLRLQILQRKALFDDQKGRELFDKIYAEIINPVGVV